MNENLVTKERTKIIYMMPGRVLIKDNDVGDR